MRRKRKKTPPSVHEVSLDVIGDGPLSFDEETSQARYANIGGTIEVRGELNGDENVTVEGLVEGQISLPESSLLVGPRGCVRAEIEAQRVIVHGCVEGNITATERVEISASGKMDGDIRAPRVVLADGATFRGSIDMDDNDAGADVEDTLEESEEIDTVRSPAEIFASPSEEPAEQTVTP